jgi:uroporphyrinogen-III decarboxylase
VSAWARSCIEKTAGRGLIISAGGGVSPDTPPEMIDALVGAMHSYEKDSSAK